MEGAHAKRNSTLLLSSTPTMHFPTNFSSCCSKTTISQTFLQFHKRFFFLSSPQVAREEYICMWLVTCPSQDSHRIQSFTMLVRQCPLDLSGILHLGKFYIILRYQSRQQSCDRHAVLPLKLSAPMNPGDGQTLRGIPLKATRLWPSRAPAKTRIYNPGSAQYTGYPTLLGVGPWWDMDPETDVSEPE